MSTSFTVALNDPNHFAQDAALVADVSAAAADWLRFFSCLGTIDIQVNVAATPAGRASGGTGAVLAVGTDGPRTVVEPGSLYEMLTGIDPNGASPDIIITVDPSYLLNELWLDPDPAHPSAIPSNRTDGMSVVRHEIGHGLGITGYRNQTTGALPADHESVWDRLVQLHPDGSAWFVGANARFVYGGDVPVTTLSNGEQYFHLGNGRDAATRDLMNGVAFFHATSYNISTLDIAILRDLGAPDDFFGDGGSNTLVGTFLSDGLFGLGGNDVLSGGDALTLTPHEASIFRLYEATLARIPDNAGLSGWTAALDGGTPLVNIAAGFVNSSEFQSQYGALDNTQFVTLLYNNVLGRAPDASGLSGWVDALNGGASRASVVLGFSESLEFKSSTQLAADAYDTTDFHGAAYGQVYRLYGASLHREPDTAGFEGWDDALAGGQSLVNIAAGFVNSVEFQATYGALNNTQYVTLLYNNVLGRAPDASGLKGWVDTLNAGTSRASVLVGFSDSPEYQSNTASGLQNFMQHSVPNWSDTLDGGAGSNQLLGGRGPDLFVFNANDHATDKVYGIELWDRLLFTNFGYSASSQPMTHMTQSGHDVVFADKGTTVTFYQTDLAALGHLNYLV